MRDEELRFFVEAGTLLRDFGEDGVDVKADIDVVRNRGFVIVFGNQILIEEAKRLLGRGGG